jgi:hypothetical protein
MNGFRAHAKSRQSGVGEERAEAVARIIRGSAAIEVQPFRNEAK